MQIASEQLYAAAPKDCLWNICQHFCHKSTLWPLLFAHKTINLAALSILAPLF